MTKTSLIMRDFVIKRMIFYSENIVIGSNRPYEHLQEIFYILFNL